MPVVEPNENAKVLVTGANGYIAMWIIRTLLEQGYFVRGVVRSKAKGVLLNDYFKAYGTKLEMVVVEDMMKDGAFDEAVKDVDAIEHTASPLPEASEDPNDLIQPAIAGTLGILKSAMKFGTKVKRIVLTSSCGAIIGVVEKPTAVFDETHWGDDFVAIVQEQGKAASKWAKYRASKTLAEQAAWSFYKENKQKLSWDLVALNPPLVLGPPLQNWKHPRELCSSLATFYEMIFKEQPDDALKINYAYIDIRDIAAAHVMSLRKQEAGGQRMIVSEGAITWQETRNRLYALFPQLYETGVLPRGNAELDTTILFDYNPAKGKEILGLEYAGLDQMLRDTMADLEGRGWIQGLPKVAV